ncbi:hypothetical protein KM043_002014 [Ampulex compressa]|nr:hypothetical protein KM043_002014 [Ampulex compressa]
MLNRSGGITFGLPIPTSLIYSYAPVAATYAAVITLRCRFELSYSVNTVRKGSSPTHGRIDDGEAKDLRMLNDRQAERYLRMNDYTEDALGYGLELRGFRKMRLPRSM